MYLVITLIFIGYLESVNILSIFFPFIPPQCYKNHKLPLFFIYLSGSLTNALLPSDSISSCNYVLYYFLFGFFFNYYS